METKKENKVKTVFGAVGIMLLYLLIQLAISIVISIFGTLAMTGENIEKDALIDIINKMKPLMVFISNFISTVLFGVWYYLGYVRKSKKTGTYESGLKRIGNAKALAFIFCSAMSVGLFDRHIADLTMLLFPGSKDMFNTVMDGLTELTFVNVVSTVILSAAATAFAFSGIMMQSLKKSFGMAGCIIIPAILLAILMFNPVQSIYGIPFGLVMMFVSYKFNSAIAGMLVIMVNNIGSIVINGVVKRDIPPVISGCFVIIFLVLSYILYRKLPASQKDENPVSNDDDRNAE